MHFYAVFSYILWPIRNSDVISGMFTKQSIIDKDWKFGDPQLKCSREAQFRAISDNISDFFNHSFRLEAAS